MRALVLFGVAVACATACGGDDGPSSADSDLGECGGQSDSYGGAWAGQTTGATAAMALGGAGGTSVAGDAAGGAGGTNGAGDAAGGARAAGGAVGSSGEGGAAASGFEN